MVTGSVIIELLSRVSANRFGCKIVPIFLSVLGLQIIGAHMSVTHDGYSLDTFIIRSTQWSQLEDEVSNPK